MTNYNKTTRPELLQIIRKYNKDTTTAYLKIKNYNHDAKYLLVKTCEAIDGGDDAVKAFINGGKDTEKNDKNDKKATKADTPPSVSPVKADTPPSVSPVKADTPPSVSPVKTDEDTDDDTDETDDDADDTKEKKKETRADFELRIRAIAKAKYPKDPSAQLRFMVEKCDGIIGGIRFG
jgi:hypothetical protein